MERALGWQLPLKSPSEEPGVTLSLPQMLPLARRNLLVPPERAGSIGHSKSAFRRFRSWVEDLGPVSGNMVLKGGERMVATRDSTGAPIWSLQTPALCQTSGITGINTQCLFPSSPV